MDGEGTLLCFSGGLSSRAMLWAALEPLRSAPQRLNTNTYTVLYVDEGRYARGEIEAFLQSFGVDFVVRNLLEGAPDENASDRSADLRWHAKTRMFFQVAQELGCAKIYTAENSTKTAIRIIEFTAKGRGYSLPFDVKRNDSNSQTLHISLVRPLAEHTVKEVAFFCRFNGLLDRETGLHLKKHSFSVPNASIAAVTEHFIMGLERDYSSTVSTVSKTANKFTTPIIKATLELGSVGGPRCRICDCLIPAGIAEWFLGTTVLDLESNKSCTLERHPEDLCYACCMLV